jgi:acetylornithine deacetylase/succinyl-diaminopimelate desuccinylase-like protein
MNDWPQHRGAGLRSSCSDVLRRAIEQVAAAGASPEQQIDAAAAVLSRDPLYNATLRTGQSLTLITGGIRSNVIPSERRATFNVRALPILPMRLPLEDELRMRGAWCLLSDLRLYLTK